MFGIGFTEIVVILVIALIVLGPEKLPELAKALGRAMREFRTATDDIRRSVSVSDIDLNVPDHRPDQSETASPAGDENKKEEEKVSKTIESEEEGKGENSGDG